VIRKIQKIFAQTTIPTNPTPLMC